MAGYHVSIIPRGQVGQFSKVEEEFQEFQDAMAQHCHVMALIELADLVGSIKCYFASHERIKEFELQVNHVLHQGKQEMVDIVELSNYFNKLSNACEEHRWSLLSAFMSKLNNYMMSYNLGLQDLLVMAQITERVFVNGYRQSSNNSH